MPAAIQSVHFPSKNFDIPGHFLVPAETGGALPGLVVLHDLYGLDEATMQAARRLADFGCAVAVPDLFAASGGPKDTSSEAALLDYTQSLFDTHLIRDTIAALNWLTKQENIESSALGVVGWGWGGAYALMAAAHDARLRVAADIGGAISYPVLTPKKPGSPLNFVANLEGALFAAFPDGDSTLPGIEIDRLKGRLQEHDKRGEVKVYTDTPPRFWRDDKLPQTQLLWRRLRSFLDENIQSPELWDEGYPNEEYRLHA